MPPHEPPPEVKEYFRKIGKRYGSEGGRKAAANMTPAQRKRRAKLASEAAAAALSPAQRKKRAQLAAKKRWAKKPK